jgi:hypothetical protein
VIYLRHWSTLLEAVLPLPLSEAYCSTYSSEENFPKLLGTHAYKNCHEANVNEHGEWEWMYHLIWNPWWQEQRVSNKHEQKATLFDVQVITGKLKTHDTEAQKHISMLINWTTWGDKIRINGWSEYLWSIWEALSWLNLIVLAIFALLQTVLWVVHAHIY